MEVRSSSGSYSIEFASLTAIATDLPSNSFVITDRNVWSHWGSIFDHLPTLVLEPGEASKRLAGAETCYRWLAHHGATRSSTILAFGGGVIGDLAGFVAATYMRGVRLIQVPTTLLAMVDSSVGGKVGVDLPEGKNLVGAFYPPQKVLIPLETLGTLPPREFTNGMAEVCKYGAIMDAQLFGELSRGVSRGQMQSLIKTCISHKADVVQEDEFETTGRRAILNFGHTVGHALEKVTGYSDLLHGEAISIGMVVESRIGESIGHTKTGTTEQLRACLESNGLPTELPLVEEQELIAAMKLDKKALPGQLAFSLLTHIGGCKLCTGVPEEAVLAALKSR
jgi:3-dehydroquinate synthase